MKDRAELLVRQEFDKAVQALADGNLPLAAFYSGALAHYMGDLGQFYHIMGSQSHWGSEDPKTPQCLRSRSRKHDSISEPNFDGVREFHFFNYSRRRYTRRDRTDRGVAR